MFLISNPVVSDLNSFINTFRFQRIQRMTTSPRSSVSYPPVSYQPSIFDTKSETNFNGSNQLRAISPNDLQKMKYKIDLGSISFYFSFILI